MRPIRIGRFEINKTEIIGLVVALVMVILGLIFLIGTNLFYFILGISFVVGGFPFFLRLIFESRSMDEKNRMFLEFARNLVENVKAGTPISKGILNVKQKDYGDLNPHVHKLANQISMGIPIKTSFDTFARDIGSPTITKAINIIGESEKAGGQIEDILESVVQSVSQIEKLRKERKSAMYTLIVQGYIIFMIFIVIMLVMEFKILPIATRFGEDFSGDMGSNSISGIGNFGGMMGSSSNATPEELSRPFLWLLISQGIFTGLVIGKLAEGSVKAGLKHSFVLLVLSLLINTGAKVLLGGAFEGGLETLPDASATASIIGIGFLGFKGTNIFKKIKCFYGENKRG